MSLIVVPVSCPIVLTSSSPIGADQATPFATPISPFSGDGGSGSGRSALASASASLRVVAAMSVRCEGCRATSSDSWAIAPAAPRARPTALRAEAARVPRGLRAPPALRSSSTAGARPASGEESVSERRTRANAMPSAIA